MAVKKLTKNQRRFAILTVSLLLAYSFVNLGLAINGFIKLKNNIKSLEDYKDNWTSTTITDLQVTTGSCPGGYVSAFSDRAWPGTNTGCWCGSVSASVKSAKNITCDPFCKGSCSSSWSSAGCSDVAGKSAVTYNYGSKVMSSGVATKAQLCIKRTDETLVTNANVAESGSCPSGYTTCGSDDYLFCTKQSSCPITYIQTGTLAQGSKGTCLSSNGCYLIADDGSTSVSTITFKRYTAYADFPQTQFTVNEYSMCSTEEESNKTPGRYLFYLLKSRPSGCGTEGASKWSTLYTTNEYTLFNTNNVDISGFASYTDSSHGLTGGYYPTAETGTSYSYGLFNRGYYPWKAKCRSKLSTLVKNIDKVSQTKTAQTALLVVGVLSAAAIGIGLSTMELLNLFGKDLPCIRGKEEEERTKIKKIKKIVAYCFKGIQIPFQLWAIVICAMIKDYFAEIANDECSNSEVNATMKYFAKTFKSTYSSNVTSIAITLASIAFDVIMSCRKTPQTAPQASSPGDEKTALKNLSQRKEIDDQPNQGFHSPASFPPSHNPNPIVSPPHNHSNNFNAQPYQPAPQQQPQYVQTQYIPQQQAPPQQFAPQQYPPQQMPNQYPPQQFPPNQFPPQQYPNQFPPQQYPPNQFPPQQHPNQFPLAQQPATNNDYNPTEKFGRANYY